MLFPTVSAISILLGIPSTTKLARVATAAESVGRQLLHFAGLFIREWGWAAAMAGVIGWALALRRSAERQAAAGLLGAFLLAGPAFFILSNLPLDAASTVPSVTLRWKVRPAGKSLLARSTAPSGVRATE